MKRSVSLYSYQDEYYEGKLNLESCLAEVSKTGAEGVELLAEQMIKRFPDSIDEESFQEQWKVWLEKYQLKPVCYDAFLENKLFDNRTLTLREQVKMMKRDIRLASILGFKVLRTLVSTPLEVIEGSLAYAKEKDVKIGIEVHAPFSLNSTWADSYLDLIKRTGTKHFGFIPDLGIFCKSIPDVVRDKALIRGAKPECVALVDKAYEKRVEDGFIKIEYDLNLGKANMAYREANGLSKLLESVKAMGGGKADLDYANASFTYSWSDPQDLIDNIDHIIHIHAKFYNVHDDYVETSVAIPEIIDALKTAGYSGYLSSEYEGGEHLRNYTNVDSIEQVRRHQQLLKDSISLISN
ncbi:Xylose isomerase-like TIM barrel [Streptococcus varani]|uniref:Xylose isomerase-like TIM barrel n=1 Tax=Streptococcus varani TaxID=1608583 RepID=A0A0E4H3V6_9STRE|nr:TIM barrel protein [Streptococcus varani]CQR24160.1 Xylose isomerase-like TIM barrel [Streptococcus varani]